MSYFAFKEISQFDCPGNVLVLNRGGRCDFDEFYEEIEKSGNMKSDLYKFSAILQQVVSGVRLPEEKYRDITNNDSTVREYEIKTKYLRFYLVDAIIDQRAFLIVLGGRKTNQKKDIVKFKSYIKDLKIQNVIK